MKSALIDAMLDHSLSMDLGPEEWLTVAARQSDGPLSNNQIYDVSTIVLRVKGSDLAAYWPIAPGGPRSGRRSTSGSSDLQFADAGTGRRDLVHRCVPDPVARRVSSGCGAPVDVKQVVQITDISGGWFDAGIKDGKNKLTPSVTFRVTKKTEDAIRPLALNLAFKKITAAGEEDFDDFYIQSVSFGHRQRERAAHRPHRDRLHRRPAAVARRHAPSTRTS